MTIIADKLLILFFCLYTMLNRYPAVSYIQIAALLISVGCSLLCTYQNPELQSYQKLTAKWPLTLLFLVYWVLCLIHPIFCFFLPLLLYDIYTTRKLTLVLISGLPFLTAYTDLTSKYILFILLISAISILIQNYHSRNKILTEKLKLLRDSSTEYHRMLQQKNKTLLEKQDYEVYLATLKERNRIAREIHDNVGHMLSRSILQVGALMALGKDSPLFEHLEALKSTLSGAMDSIRKSVHDLHDEAIDLEAVITTMIKDFSAYRMTLDYDMGKDIPRNVKYCFIAILKEALSNIVKHSNADLVRITLREHPSMHQLVITDNGTKAETQNTGIGLENMRERVAQLNGNFTITTTNGFQIFITIPKTNEV